MSVASAHGSRLSQLTFNISRPEHSKKAGTSEDTKKSHEAKKSDDKVKLSDSKHEKAEPTSKSNGPDTSSNLRDEFILSLRDRGLQGFENRGHGHAHRSEHQPVGWQPVESTSVTNNTDNSVTTTDNSVNHYTVNNYYYGGAQESGGTLGSGTNNQASQSTVNNVISPDLTALNDRLDALTSKLDMLGDAVASFKELAFNFEKQVGNFQVAVPVVRGGLQGGGGISFDNYNFALSFARKGFNVVDIMKSGGASLRTAGLDDASESLTRSLESLKSQSSSLFDAKNSLSGFFSSNSGTALNQSV